MVCLSVEFYGKKKKEQTVKSVVKATKNITDFHFFIQVFPRY